VQHHKIGKPGLGAQPQFDNFAPLIDAGIMMNYLLETERMRLKELTLRDKEFIIALLNSPGWLKYIGDREVKTIDQAQAYLKNGPLKSYQEHGFGLWLVESKAEVEPIGLCGLIKRETLDLPDLGFAFMPEYMGKGFGFEMAQAVLKFVRSKIKEQRVCAIVNPANAASLRLLEKIGFVFQKTVHFSDREQELLLFIYQYT
jgi:RimJ/RimL family protein N-acetyltransferase